MSIASRKAKRAARKTSLREKAQKSTSNTNYNDDRVWSCERDSTGKGDAVIRFLPPTDEMIDYFVEHFDFEEDEVPCAVHYHRHAFKGDNGKWYIENCPTSVVERECPVCEANSDLVDGFGGWDAVDDNHPDKKKVRNRKRKEVYVSNILVVRDPAHPENEGKVFIFKYGKAIHDMIMAQLIPEFDDEEECDVSDLWDGRDFKLKIVKKDGYANYDKSSWADPSVAGGDDDDDVLEELMEKCHKIIEDIAESKYKSYEDLEKQFKIVTGKGKPRGKNLEDQGDDSGDDSPQGEPEKEEKPKRSRRTPKADKSSSAKSDKPKKEKVEKKPEPDTSTDDDEDDAFFQSLLDD